MTEAEALARSTGWADEAKGFIGHLPFAAANALVGTGRYEFWQTSCWGYTVRRR